MTPLQLFLVLISFVLLIFAIDAYKRKGINALHFLVFFVWLWLIILFSVEDTILDKFWAYFGLSRWADLLVYISIIFLAYLYFEITHKLTKQKQFSTDLVKLQTIKEFWQQNDKNEIIQKTKSMKAEKDKFVFLVRCFNEQEILLKTINEIIWKWYSKILIVNDWSTDNSEDIINQIKQQNPDKIILDLHHIINCGGWAANKTWLFFLQKYWKMLDINYIITFDADNQMDINDMPKFQKAIKNNDIVLGSRFTKWWGMSNIPRLRKVVLLGSRFVTLFLNWIWSTDPHNWYRAININALDKIHISSDNMTYASEILDSINKNKLKFEEVPVNIRYTDYSISKWQKNSNALIILWEIIYKKFFFR